MKSVSSIEEEQVVDVEAEDVETDEIEDNLGGEYTGEDVSLETTGVDVEHIGLENFVMLLHPKVETFILFPAPFIP